MHERRTIGAIRLPLNAREDTLLKRTETSDRQPLRPSNLNTRPAFLLIHPVVSRTRIEQHGDEAEVYESSGGLELVCTGA